MRYKKFWLLIFIIALQCNAQTPDTLLQIQMNNDIDYDKMQMNRAPTKPLSDSLTHSGSFALNDSINLYEVSSWTSSTLPANNEWNFTDVSYTGLGIFNLESEEWTLNHFLVNAFLQLITDKYEEYEKECYADSTLECYNIYDFYGDISYIKCSTEHDFDLGFNPNYRGTEDIWVHREPTFKGFMEHLKKEIE